MFVQNCQLNSWQPKMKTWIFAMPKYLQESKNKALEK